MQNEWTVITRRWIGRLSFSFFVIGFFLAWEGYKRHTSGGIDDWRTLLDFAAGAVSISLGFTGLRERHRTSGQ